MIDRRALLAGASAIASGAGARWALAAQATQLRVGTQKGAGILMAERQRRGLETLLNPIGIDVHWAEFPFGPPILEAMRVGSVDIGLVGDTPPIFAQAAKSDLLYVAAVPSGASAILLPAGSPLQSLRDLKGKRVAFARGSSAHNLTIAAVEKAGLAFTDIQPVSLAPADAAAAFEKGAIDAWTIWDPFYALYATRPGVRVLANASDIVPQNSFIIASRSFVETNPSITAKVLTELANVSDWATTHRDEVARLVTAGTGMSLEATTRAADRSPFQVLPLTPDIIHTQQDIADRFQRLGVIPGKITIADQVWEWHPAA
jgi:NitT/TauT family transport system substrate-binding protein/sulfonate transport system substrate-binding protein